MRQNRSISGYSLIELLVTIIVVALLLGLLLPALQRVRASAQQVQCLANQSANGKSLLMHTFEQDGRFPPMFHGFSPGQSGKILVHVEPRTPKEAGIEYMDVKSRVCPRDQKRGTVPVRKRTVVIDEVMSYGYNIELAIKKATLTGLIQPSRQAVLFDGTMSGPAGGGKNVSGAYANSYAFVAAAHIPRHDHDLNVVFADWHARSVDRIKPEQVLLP